ncbi:hypothetical protein CDL12_01467 [Handroanthus impetiginosus]|uniref:RING-CH-type domain-containing protein n=1 Tax=Handroanthus impetiginosus TaxID=429701 RepID=A0A2G9I7P6_9LAMI|nr:hypothetical protein CDL12_01467 [Handroanthus impetiginosus]
MESSDESQDMSNGQQSSITMVNNVSPDTPSLYAAVVYRPGFVAPPPTAEQIQNISYPCQGGPPSGFAWPPNFLTRTRKLELNLKQLVTIIEKTSQLYFQGVEVEKIPREDAVCRFCFNLFQEDNVLKTKCKCKFTLIHESCAIEWSEKKGNKKCDVCEQDIQNIPVTLSTDHNSSDTNKKVKGNSTLSRFYGCIGSSADQ